MKAADGDGGQPPELVTAILCDAYPFLVARIASTDDGYLDVGLLMRMRELLGLWRIVSSAIRKPPRVKGPHGWQDNWTQVEQDVMYSLMELRRKAETDDAGS